jgi:outer membrane protein assembly factor BamB
MAHLDLEEQEKLDQLKQFWKQYGGLISWGLIMLLSLYAGWNVWQYWQNRQAVQATALYEEVERIAAGGDAARLDRALSDMKDKFARTAQAQQAALLAAAVHASAGRSEQARAALAWVAEAGRDEGYQALARLRLAGLLLDAKSYDEALKQLAVYFPPAFAGLAADRRGDVYLAQGKKAEAGAEYQKAWAALDAGGSYRQVVDVKLAALGLVPRHGRGEEVIAAPASLRFHRLAFLALLAALLGACSSARKAPEPPPLPADPRQLNVRVVWSAEIGKVEGPMTLQAVGPVVGVGAANGAVHLIDARTGESLWRASAGSAPSTGVGHDGQRAAVVTVGNELVVLQDGKELWRQRLTAPSYTPPLVAGGRVFVLGADRSVSAYDGLSGRRLWIQNRSGEPLVLRQPGVLVAVGDTLVVGLGVRLAGLNPLNGSSRWELPMASPRGTNDVERLVDLVAGVARQSGSVCVRSFQATVGCVDATRGALQWSKPAAGASGLSGDAERLVGVEFDGTVLAWRRSDGERVWSNSQMRYRKLGTPLLLGATVVIGDESGRLHFLSRADGARCKRGSRPDPHRSRLRPSWRATPWWS